jgi:predicted nucleic acid-binding protein
MPSCETTTVVCILITVRRIQLHLDEDLDEALARQAAELGLSKAAVHPRVPGRARLGEGPWERGPECSAHRDLRQDSRRELRHRRHRLPDLRLADTSFWIALAAAKDRNHSDAVALWSSECKPVVVTNHVTGETWTCLRRRAGHGPALAALAVFRSARVRLVHVEEKAEAEAWSWLARHDERRYSFVDATSFALMRRLRVREALAFDGDFSAAGFVELRP